MKTIYYPRVGVEVFVLNEQNKILLGKRKNAHGNLKLLEPHKCEQ